MYLSYAQPDQMTAYYVGNILRKEGIEDKTALLKFTDDAKKSLGLLITTLQNKLTPYIQKQVEYEIPTLSIFDQALKDHGTFPNQALKLATKLYETNVNINIVPGTFLAIAFTAYTAEQTDGIAALALLTMSSTRKGISINQSFNQLEINAVDVLDEDTIDQVAIYYENSNEVWIRDKKSIPNQYWINNFLQVKPVMTEPKSADLATKIIKNVYGKIKNVRHSNAFRNEIKELVHDSESITFGELEECSKRYINEETFDDIKKDIEKKSSIHISENNEVPTNILDQKIKQFIKTISITPDHEITLKGQTEHIKVEKLHSSYQNKILIEITINETK